MKPLLRQAVRCHGTVALAGTVLCLVVAFGTSHATQGHDLLLFGVFPALFLAAHVLLADMLWGVWTVRADRVDAGYPGPRGQLVFARFLAPVIGAAAPYLVLVGISFAGLYWLAQTRLFGWPAVANSADLAALMFLRPAFIMWLAWGIVQCFGLMTDAGDAKRSLWALRGLAMVSAIVLALAVVVAANGTPIDAMRDVSGGRAVVLALGPLLAAVYMAVIRPHRPTRFLSLDCMRHAVFIGGVLGILYAAGYQTLEMMPWPRFFAVGVVGLISWYRAGWLAGLLCAPLGVSCWTTVFWLCAFPDTVRCACTRCGAVTHSWHRACPACAEALHGRPSTVAERVFARVRLSAAITVTVVFMPIISLVLFSPLDHHKLHARRMRQATLVCAGPYGISNIVITVQGVVRGTDSWSYVYYGNNNPVSKDSMTLSANGVHLAWETMTSFSEGKRVTTFVLAYPSTADATPFARLLMCADYDLNRIPADAQPTEQELAGLHARNFPFDANRSLRAGYEAAVRRMWSSLTPEQQAARRAWYYSEHRWFTPQFMYALELCTGIDKNVIPPDLCPVPFSADPAAICLFTPYATDREKSEFWGSALGYATAAGRGIARAVIRRNPASIPVAGWIAIERPDRLRECIPLLPTMRARLRTQTERDGDDLSGLFHLYRDMIALNPDAIGEEDKEKLKEFREVLPIDRPWAWEALTRLTEKHPAWVPRLAIAVAPRAFTAPNAFNACRRIVAALSRRDRQDTYLLDMYPRLETNEAMTLATACLKRSVDGFEAELASWRATKIREVLGKRIEHQTMAELARGDSVNRAAIMRSCVAWCAETKTNTTVSSIIADIVHEYPYPGAVESLGQLRAATTGEEQKKIDGYIADVHNLERTLLPRKE